LAAGEDLGGRSTGLLGFVPKSNREDVVLVSNWANITDEPMKQEVKFVYLTEEQYAQISNRRGLVLTNVIIRFEKFPPVRSSGVFRMLIDSKKELALKIEKSDEEEAKSPWDYAKLMDCPQHVHYWYNQLPNAKSFNVLANNSREPESRFDFSSPDDWPCVMASTMTTSQGGLTTSIVAQWRVIWMFTAEKQVL